MHIGYCVRTEAAYPVTMATMYVLHLGLPWIPLNAEVQRKLDVELLCDGLGNFFHLAIERCTSQ